jgi:hypothetical protein
MKRCLRTSLRTPLATIAVLALALSGSACAGGETSRDQEPADGGTAGGDGDLTLAGGITPADMEARLEQFAPVTLTFDASTLDDGQRKVLRKLVEASVILDGLFLRQVWEGNPGLRERLQASHGEGMDAARQYFDIMYGPWDRLLEEEPFLDVGEKPLGAGYYEEDLTVTEIEAWLEEHPDDAESFGSYFTVIRRDGDALVAVPYSEYYRTELEAAATLLREAAELAENESLGRYLSTRADALLSDDYFDSDVAWMRLEDHLIDPTIGPYEVYEDRLFGYKAAFESFITIRDPAQSARLAELEGYMPDLEAALPIPDELRGRRHPGGRTDPGLQPAQRPAGPGAGGLEEGDVEQHRGGKVRQDPQADRPGRHGAGAGRGDHFRSVLHAHSDARTGARHRPRLRHGTTGSYGEQSAS